MGLLKQIPRNRDVTTVFDSHPTWAWTKRITVPFTYAFSKNHIYSMRGQGHVVLREESKGMRDAVTQLFREAIRDQKIYNNKLWIEVFIEKPNHRGDAINVIDLVCDGIKTAIDVDDRWFAIWRLDWAIEKNDPQIYIGIGQEECEDAIACSYCGQILALHHFNKNQRNKHGVSRCCRECQRLLRSECRL